MDRARRGNASHAASALGEFIVPYDTEKNLDWSPRTKVISVAAATVLMFAVAAMVWTGFLYADACLDAGGKMVAETCTGARHLVPEFWQTPWPNIALGLLPPTIGAIIFAMVAWRASRVGGEE
jgi:hypothetical protein